MDFGVGSQASRSGEGHRSTSIPGTGYSATPSVLPPTRSTYPTSPGHTCPRTTPTTSRSRRRAARALRPTVTSSTHGNSNSMFPSRAAPPANGAQHILPAGGVARPTARTKPGQASIRASVQLTASSSRDGRSDRQAPRPDLYYPAKHDRARQTLHGSTNRSASPKRPGWLGCTRSRSTCPPRVATSARRLRLHLPKAWPWQSGWTDPFTAVETHP